MVEISRKPWLLAVLIVSAAAMLLVIIGRSQLPAAQAESQFGSANDISVFSVQLSRDSYGIAMVDRTAETIWIYEINGRAAGQSRLRLLAARSWKYDRRLEDLNNADPRPDQIKALLESIELQRKEPNKGRQTGINILELAEPNSN